jgi:transcription elongation factor GreA
MAVSKEVVLTPEGLESLEKELSFLKSVKRREVAGRIKTAISFGDISENSEYEDAKNEQAFIEGRIITLEKMLRNARIIDAGEVDTDVVSIGSTVALKDLEFDESWSTPLWARRKPTLPRTRFPTSPPWAKRFWASPSGASWKWPFLPAS